MKKSIKFLCLMLIFLNILFICSCHKSSEKALEDSSYSGLGVVKKSALNESDFYFLAKGSLYNDVLNLLGSPHNLRSENPLCVDYSLSNGDRIELYFSDEKLTGAYINYAESIIPQTDFLNYLSSIGVLSGDIKSTKEKNTQKNNQTTAPSEIKDKNLFSSESYKKDDFVGKINIGVSRDFVINNIGKPTSFSSHDFNKDSYIIDRYVLDDGSSLYIDYGYQRSVIRCACIIGYNGSYSLVTGDSWSPQNKPAGFSRKMLDKSVLKFLKHDLSPTDVYKLIGEPHWYEGNQNKYSDAFILSDGTTLYLDFGEYHNALNSAYILNADGSEKIYSLK